MRHAPRRSSASFCAMVGPPCLLSQGRSHMCKVGLQLAWHLTLGNYLLFRCLMQVTVVNPGPTQLTSIFRACDLLAGGVRLGLIFWCGRCLAARLSHRVGGVPRAPVLSPSWSWGLLVLVIRLGGPACG